MTRENNPGQGKRRCVFCGCNGKLDKEHVIAEWIGQELAHVGEGRHQRSKAFGEVEAEWRGEAHTSRVGTVCPGCNSGWMSDLEGEVRPWLLPMLRGHHRTYSSGGLTVLATWAAKTALVISSDGPSFPSTAFEVFYRDRRPSDSTQVWVGSYALGPLQHWRNRVPVFIGPPEANRGAANAYSVTFTVGYAAFHVFGNESGGRTEYGFEGPLAQSLRQIWPLPEDPVTWPPLPPLNGPQLDAIGNAHGEVFT